MSDLSAEVVICGAGIAGIATAYHLAVKHNLTDVIIVDPESPLSVTSDKSFEGYRNWWPGPGDAMVALMNHSIDLLEEMHAQQPDLLAMDRGGYVFVSGDATKAEAWIAGAQESCELGAGELRIHDGRADAPIYTPITEHGLLDAPPGADILLDQALIREHFPHLSQETKLILHARRCGWFAARQFGMHMLEKAREQGVRLLRGEVIAVETTNSAVSAVQVMTETGQVSVQTSNFVNAAGPGQKKVGQMLGVEVPVLFELHMKVAIQDHKRLIPRNMPLTIWMDTQMLDWSDEERAFLAEDEQFHDLLEQYPPIVVTRPDGGPESQIVLIQSDHRIQPHKPLFPLPMDEWFPELTLRALCTMLPKLATYLDHMPNPYMDGGYYVRTLENRPIVGPIQGIKGAFILGGLGGSGMQLAPATGELLADHIANAPLPHYAPAFLLERYDDPDYQKLVAEWDATGNL
ncbi:MAG: NAD(P)/FAD-dependent oxidoreductase [Ardenticatenaceae bacterium]